MNALRLGPIPVDPPVVLAPMAGVTNPAFRQVCREFGPGLYVSEMVTARALLEYNERTLRMVARAPGETVHSVQLYGVDPATMDRAVRILVEEIGVDHIDMNFGCPAPKVTRRGGGAALPAHPELFRLIVRAATTAAGAASAAAGRAPVPVTVKMRIGIDDAVETATEAGLIAEQEGAAAVALHARTAEQRYSGTARWDAIARLKESIREIPVLGNGDVWEAEDALAMQRETGCDGVVVGRGCLGRPWLFRDLAAAYRDPRHKPQPWQPNLGEVARVMVRHARLLVEQQVGVRDFRKHTGWYLTGFPVGPAVRRELALVDTVEELEERLAALDPTLERPAEWGRWPRGHTDGPRPIDLPDGWLQTRDDPTPPAGAELLVSGG